MIQISSKGDFSKTQQFLERIKEKLNLGILNKYGKEGVKALSNATPVNTGKTAESWSYKIERDRTGVKLSFHNSNIVDGVPIAIILQYGHGTRNGGYVQGSDYINPTVKPIFEKLADEMWKEVVK